MKYGAAGRRRPAGGGPQDDTAGVGGLREGEAKPKAAQRDTLSRVTTAPLPPAAGWARGRTHDADRAGRG